IVTMPFAMTGGVFLLLFTGVNLSVSAAVGWSQYNLPFDDKHTPLNSVRCRSSSQIERAVVWLEDSRRALWGACLLRGAKTSSAIFANIAHEHPSLCAYRARGLLSLRLMP
ncbi:hypothetical protein, partial [Hyphomicrobium sulfonivorans]|uniref:hypothetical protein n=1 Tax=Hyphomicrobium sulfonivorans TaxID=121290 RepID=UPI001AEC2609